MLDDDLKRIAARIRSWRGEAGLTLQQLGDQAGVSASTIHKIENHQTIPTITVLLKLVHALNRRPSELLSAVEGGQQVTLLRVHERADLQLSRWMRLEHLIAVIPHSRLDVWRCHLEPSPDAGSQGGAWQRQGELILIVEEGRVEVEVAGEVSSMVTGDSIHFDSSVSHRWSAGDGQGATLMICALLPEPVRGDSTTLEGAASGDMGSVVAVRPGIPVDLVP